MAKPRTPRMHKSKCRWCRPAILFLDDEKVAEGFVCLLEEWDEETVCRKGYCRHHKEKNRAQAARDGDGGKGGR